MRAALSSKADRETFSRMEKQLKPKMQELSAKLRQVRIIDPPPPHSSLQKTYKNTCAHA
eukprot:COSAG05_NODE_2961_length_2461_cov_4.234124_3_plen_59_part_00